MGAPAFNNHAVNNPDVNDDVTFHQRLLNAMGYDAGPIDGVRGPMTAKAAAAFARDADALQDAFGARDDRSERNIRTLHIAAQERVRGFLTALDAASFPFAVRIISGARSYAAQNRLYAKGRNGDPDPKVTNARGGQSRHNFAIAWDIGLFEDGRYLTGATQVETRAYRRVAEIVDLKGLEWGGDWSRFVDLPHYQLDTGNSLSETRALFEMGRAYV
ncbi:MAG: M15 family metallopeptidase [Pseudomonadota bacterium]